MGPTISVGQAVVQLELQEFSMEVLEDFGTDGGMV